MNHKTYFQRATANDADIYSDFMQSNTPTQSFKPTISARVEMCHERSPEKKKKLNLSYVKRIMSELFEKESSEVRNEREM